MFNKFEKYSGGIKFSSLELENYFIDFVPAERNILYITFENADQPQRPRLDRLREPWGLRPIHDLGCCLLAIKPKAADWYRGRDLHEFFRSANFAAFLSGFVRVILYGSSMGGYAALTFVAACPDADVIAINPQTTLDPVLVPWEKRYPEGKAQNWKGDFSDAAQGVKFARHAYVLYDPLLKVDRLHVERLPNANNNVVFLKTPLLGHSLPAWLQQMGVLKEILIKITAGSISPAEFSVLCRKRRNIPRYYLEMARKTKNKNVAKRCVEQIVSRFKLDDVVRDEVLSVCEKHQLGDMANNLAATMLDKDAGVSEKIKIARSLMEKGYYSLAQQITTEVQKSVGAQVGCELIEAEIQFRTKNTKMAENLSRALVQSYPTSAHSHRLLARVLWAQGQKTEALAVIKIAVELDPNSYVGLSECGIYQMDLKMFADAIVSFKNALRIYSGEERISHNLALCLKAAA